MTDWEPVDRWEDEVVEDGDRFDHPVPRRAFRRTLRTIAALVLAAMLFAAGTPLSWVTVLTAFLMLLIWLDLGRRNHEDDDII
jgi:uncharacterized membrane protein YdbT with pleckstrin-like domain